MTGRKGSVFGVESFASIALAVIAIVFLGFLAVKLTMFFVDADKRNAQAFINGLTAKIEALDENAYCDLPQASPPPGVGFSPPKCEVSNTFALQGVKEWVLVGWNKDVKVAGDDEIIGKDLKPQKCFDKNCLCICYKEVSKCQEFGYCREVDRNIAVGCKINYLSKKFSGATPRLKKEWVSIDNNYINLFDKLMAFPISKKSDGISISIDYGSQESTYDSDNPNKILDSLDGDQHSGNPGGSNPEVDSYIELLRNRCGY